MEPSRLIPWSRARRSSIPASALLAVLLGSCSGAVEESQAEPPADAWAFSYPSRPGSSKGLLDLRSLNEKEAGQSGFVRLTADGNGFALGDGTPARFWAVGSGGLPAIAGRDGHGTSGSSPGSA